MPIPKEILAVPRPKNSVVIAYGKNKDHYSVRARVGCRRVNGGNRPVNGPTIGHIIDGRYVPLEERNQPQNVSASQAVDIHSRASKYNKQTFFTFLRYGSRSNITDRMF